VSFSGTPDEIGSYLQVSIDKVSNHTLHGARAEAGISK
jgi:hypothetical protein